MKHLRTLGYASLILGGFLVLSYAVLAYFAIWQHEFFLVTPSTGGRILATSGNNTTAIASAFGSPVPGDFRFNDSRFNETGNASPRFPPDRGDRLFVNMSVDPMSQVLSPIWLGILLMGMFFLYNGYALITHTRKVERKETRKFVISSLLTGDEKVFYDELVKANGEATQKQLSSATGYNAVKTYRIIKRLEAKKIVRSFPFGMTNKIVLEEEK